jgi:hypothetical protein
MSVCKKKETSNLFIGKHCLLSLLRVVVQLFTHGVCGSLKFKKRYQVTNSLASRELRRALRHIIKGVGSLRVWDKVVGTHDSKLILTYSDKAWFLLTVKNYKEVWKAAMGLRDL